jgi:Protein of unknown function (DUF3616)
MVPTLPGFAQTLEPRGKVGLPGGVVHSDQLSGITFIGDRLVICPDEEASFQTLRRVAPDRYTVATTITLFSGDDVEIDLEGAAKDGTHVYLVGSHSLARKKSQVEPYLSKRTDSDSQTLRNVKGPTVSFD